MQKTKKKETVPSVKELDVNQILDSISLLRTDIISTLSDVSVKVIEKAELAKELEEKIEEYQSNLKELYSIEKEAQNLEEIKIRAKAEQENIEKKNQLLLQDLAEKEAERDKKWKRQEEEYQYEIEQKVKKFEDEFKSQVDSKNRAERARQDDLFQN